MTSPRLMHAMLRVSDMERTLAFYCGVLGMTVQRVRDNPQSGHRNVFVGYGPFESSMQIEFVSDGSGARYEAGAGFGHIAIEVADVQGFCEQLRARGVAIVREPKLLPSGTVIAFIQDPDGYSVELVRPAA